MLPRPVQAVVFDMDGLLIDSETAGRDAMMRTARDYGRELPLSVYLSMVGLAADKWQAIAVDHFGMDFPIDDYYAAVRATMNDKSVTVIALKPGVNELLDHLDTIGLPRAVATSSGHEAVRLHLGHAGILPRFHAVVAKGDTPRGKPHPDLFLHAAGIIGVPPARCLVFEDAEPGFLAAAAAGMRYIFSSSSRLQVDRGWAASRSGYR